jgi:chromosome segregation ATPase
LAETFTVRAGEETQARFKNFSDTSDFRNQAEFLNHLLTLYAAQETGLKVPSLESAISAVTDMADRVCKILIGTGETITVNQKKVTEQLDTQRKEAGDKIGALTTETDNLKTELEAQKQTIENTNGELKEAQETKKTLESALEAKTEITNVHRTKIFDLEQELKEQKKSAADAAEKLTEIDYLKDTITKLSAETERLKKDKEKAIAEQQTLRTTTINEYEKKLMDKDKELITLEKSLRAEMSEQQAAYATSVTEYEKKVFSLFKEIENSK